MNRFIQSDIAEQFENGNPKYIAGKSGAELFLEVVEKTTGDSYIEKMKPIEVYDRSDVYWVGWILAHYQWYSGRTFKSILDTISYRELLDFMEHFMKRMFKSYEVLDAHFLILKVN